MPNKVAAARDKNAKKVKAEDDSEE